MPRLPDATIEGIAAAIEAGIPPKEIRERYKVSASTVKRVAADRGLTLAPNSARKGEEHARTRNRGPIAPTLADLNDTARTQLIAFTGNALLAVGREQKSGHAALGWLLALEKAAAICPQLLVISDTLRGDDQAGSDSAAQRVAESLARAARGE